MNLAEDIIRRNGELRASRGTWDTLWQDLADYVMPRKSTVTEQKTADVNGWTDRVYDQTAIEANQVLAAGQLSYLTPSSERWFSFEHPDIQEGEAARWYRECSDIALGEIARSNFYLEAHEMYLDRGCFGTSVLYLEEHDEGGLRFANHDVGTYSICEDKDGIVDTVYREFDMTARQLVQKFGEANVSREVREKNEKCGKEAEKKFKVIHAVFPREDRDHKKIDGENKPVASVYVCVKGNHVMQEGGYDEMPYVVTRFLKWGDEAYGYCPSVTCLPNIRQINHIEKHMDALAELAAFPRVLIPSSLEGDVDLRGAGVTIFDENNPAAIPREWATQGRYDIGKDRAEDKRQAIKEAYHVDLFKMLAERQKNMTATEVLELVEEKLVHFSPTFARLVTEVFNPLLRRVFGVLYRQGMFPEPPPEVMQVTGEGVELPEPKVTYLSKIAMAIKMIESKGLLKFWEVVAPMAAVAPEVMDNFDLNKGARLLAVNFGVPSDVIRDADVVEEMRSARAQQQQMAEMAEMAKSAGSAAKDFSQADLTQIPAGL